MALVFADGVVVYANTTEVDGQVVTAIRVIRDVGAELDAHDVVALEAPDARFPHAAVFENDACVAHDHAYARDKLSAYSVQTRGKGIHSVYERAEALLAWRAAPTRTEPHLR